MANPHLRGDGRLREALLAQGHDMLVLSQALFALRLASHGLLRTQIRRSFPLSRGQRGDSCLLRDASAMSSKMTRQQAF
jgi:hypothetical protein